MIINPKLETLKPNAIKLTGFFISAATDKNVSLDLAKRTDLLAKALHGIRVFSQYNFDLFPCDGVFRGKPEPGFFVKDNNDAFDLKLAKDILDLGELFNQTCVLFANDTGDADLVKLGGFRGDFDSLNLVKNEVVHTSEVDVKTLGDCSVIDIGGGWSQVVKYTKE